MVQHLIKSALILSILATANVAAQTAAPTEPASSSDFALSANVSLASQYRYRGLMQSNNKPAIQGGLDLEHSSGLYIGNWNSSISWLSDSDPDVSSSVEMDFYAGYKREIWNGISMDIGVLHYYYPGSYPSGFTDPDTTEAYLGLGYGPVTFKYSHSFTDLFGVADSKNSQYYDLSGSFPMGVWGLTLNAHVGYQKVRNLDDGSYTDWAVGLEKDWGSGFTTSLAYIDTNADRNVYTSAKGKYTGRSAAVLTLSKAF